MLTVGHSHRRTRRPAPAPTYSEVWSRLTADERDRLAEIEDEQSATLHQLSDRFADEIDTRMFSELNVERLRIYRDAATRGAPPLDGTAPDDAPAPLHDVGPSE